MTLITCCLLVMLFACYGWGMRGTVIGGEKGAMLPGMYIGLLLALCAGGGIKEYFYIPAATGLMGMSFGGIETYGETLRMVLFKNSEYYKPFKGSLAVFVKGSLWFGVCGGLTGFSFSSMGGRYKVFEIVLFCLLIPVSQLVGYLIFNTPYDEEKGKFPKIYFSFGRHEEWGSNAGIFVLLIIFSIIKKDFISLSMCLFGGLFGGFGWIIAIWFYFYSVNPLPNGKMLFGKAAKKGYIDGWKNMEFTLGLTGGLGIFLGYFVKYKDIKNISESITRNGLFSPLENYENIAVILIAVFAVIITAINVKNFICDSKKIKYNSFLWDVIERPFFNLFPLVLVLLCSVKASRLMTVFMMIFVLCIKSSFDRFEKGKGLYIVIPLSMICSVAVFVIDIVIGGYSPLFVVLSGGFPYWISEILWHTIGKNKNELRKLYTKTSFPVVMGFEFLQIVLITILSFIFI